MQRRRAPGAAFVAIVAIAGSTVASVRAAESGRSRDVIALAGERVDAVAVFAGQAGRTVAVLLDGQLAGGATTDRDGLARVTLTAPRTPGLHPLVFGLGGAEARATLFVLDPARPVLLVDADLVARRPDAKEALTVLAEKYDLVYVHEGPTAGSAPVGLPPGAYAKVRAGGLAAWLRGLGSRGVHFRSGLVRSSEEALALHAVGTDVRVAPASLVATARALTGALAAPGTAGTGAGSTGATTAGSGGALAGRWEILDANGRTGYLDLAGAGAPYQAARDGALLGTASATGDVLDVTYGTDASAGFRGAIGDARGGAGFTGTDRYVRDPVEGAFLGTHAGVPESLRRADPGNSIDLLVDGAEMLPAFLAAIHSAKRSIHIESYIWKDEPTGRAVVDALCERLQAGVTVRAIFDGVGSMKARPLRDRLAKAGAEVVNYNPVSVSNLGAFLTTVGEFLNVFQGNGSARDPDSGGIDHRDHRKVLVVDGASAYCGGIGFSDDDVTEWHDLHSRIRGPAVARIQRHFEESWAAGGGGSLREDPSAVYPPLSAAGAVALDVVTTVPGVREEIKRAYLSRIAAAQHEVLIENPYFTDDEVVALVMAKARSGVSVTVILPRDDQNDVKMVASLHAQLRPGLWAAGVTLLDYPRMSHGKVAVVDGAWTTIGSCNLDNRSLVRNLELNVTSEDPAFAAAMKARVFARDAKVAEQWTPVSGHRTLMQKVKGLFASLFKDWL